MRAVYSGLCDERVVSQGRHDLHSLHRRQVLCSIDTSMRRVWSRPVCGVDRVERIERVHRVRGGKVRGRDGVDLGWGMRGMRWWGSDRHAGIGRRHEMHCLHEWEVLGSIDRRV